MPGTPVSRLAGWTSDWNQPLGPPRFLLAYSLRLDAIFEVLGLSLQEAGHEPMPDMLMGRASAIEAVPEMHEVEREGFIGKMVAELGKIPFFLRGSLEALCGLRRPSLKDFFWIGRIQGASHPYLAGGLLAVVNRQKKKPNDCGSRPLWQQPLYVILKRDGSYLCGAVAGRTTVWSFTPIPAGSTDAIISEIAMLRLLGRLSQLSESSSDAL
jgi:hypothetical protein